MSKNLLTKEEVVFLIKENLYRVKEENQFFSCSFEGRVDLSLKKEELSPLAKPGADFSDLFILFSTNRAFGLNLEKEEILKIFKKTFQEEKNFNFSFDFYFSQVKKNPKSYGLENEEIEFCQKVAYDLFKNGAKKQELFGEHLEGAFLIVKSLKYSIFPRLKVEDEEKMVYVYQKSLDDRRRRILAKNLFLKTKLPFSVDEEYFYEILSLTADDHLLTTINFFPAKLPVFEVIFDLEGRFEVKEIDNSFF